MWRGVGEGTESWCRAQLFFHRPLRRTAVHPVCTVVAMHEIRGLRAFRSTALTGSVRSAAERLGLAPSAVSQQVRALEEQLGLALFARSGRSLALTPDGEDMLREAERVFDALGSFEDRALALRARRSERFSVAYFSSAGVPWIADLVAFLEFQHPGLSVRLELTEGEIAEGGADLQLVVAGEEELVVPATMRSERLLVEPFVAAIPARHPLAGAPSVTLRELTDLPWIDNDDLAVGGCRCRQIVVDACRSAGVDLAFRHQAHDYRTALEMVDRGLGATVLPRLGAVGVGPSTAILPISDHGLRRSIHVAWRLDGTPNPVIRDDALRALHDLVAEESVL